MLKKNIYIHKSFKRTEHQLFYPLPKTPMILVLMFCYPLLKNLKYCNSFMSYLGGSSKDLVWETQIIVLKQFSTNKIISSRNIPNYTFTYVCTCLWLYVYPLVYIFLFFYNFAIDSIYLCRKICALRPSLSYHVEILIKLLYLLKLMWSCNSFIQL